MQINPIGIGISGVGAENTSAGVSKKPAASHPHPPETAATFSSDTATVSGLVELAMQSAPVRASKVQALQAAVSQGSYSVEPKAIASAMANELAS